MNFLSWVFSLVGVFCVTLIGSVILIRIIVKTKAGTWVEPKILIYIAGYLLLIFLSYTILLSDFSTSSKVDISPIYNLTEIADAGPISYDDYKNFERVIEESSAFKWFHSYDRYSHDFWYDYDKDPNIYPGAVACIEIQYYSNVREASMYFERDEKHSKLVRISDNLEVVLCNSEIQRSSEGLLFAYWVKYTKTYVLFDNIIISVTESFVPIKKVSKASSEAIKILCDVFAQELTKDAFLK